MRRGIIATLLLALSGTLVPIALGGAGTLQPNPANRPELLRIKLDPSRYDGAGRRCAQRNPKGMKQLIRWMGAKTKRKVYYGTIRCDGGLHGTGRALDWSLDARKRSQKLKAQRVINTWLAKDRKGRPNALARRMGIQMIIFNCRFWQSGDRGLSTYSYCRGGGRRDPTQAHVDHMHIELTRPAARLGTSFWQSRQAPGGGSRGSGGGSGGVGSGGVGGS